MRNANVFTCLPCFPKLCHCGAPRLELDDSDEPHPDDGIVEFPAGEFPSEGRYHGPIEPPDNDEDRCRHEWVASAEDDRCYCLNCGADGDA